MSIKVLAVDDEDDVRRLIQIKLKKAGFEVVTAVDPIRRIRTCPLGLDSHGERLCPLHRRLDDAMADVEDAFRRSTLAEILEEPSLSVPLCDFPGGRSCRAMVE